MTAFPEALRKWNQASSAASVSESDLARGGIQMHIKDDAVRFHFGAARNPSFAVGLTAFCVFWTGIWGVQYVLGVPWIFQALTLLIEPLFIVLCLDLWLSTTTVTIANGLVTRRYAVLGVACKRFWPGDEIQGVLLKIGTQMQGRTGTPYYNVRALLQDGRTTMIGPRIRDKRQAEWIAARMRMALGLPPAPPLRTDV